MEWEPQNCVETKYKSPTVVCMANGSEWEMDTIRKRMGDGQRRRSDTLPRLIREK